MRAAATALVLTAAIAVAWSAAPQSLGDAARKERERRAKQGKEPARTYGDADLETRKRDAPASTASASPSPSASPSAAPSGYKMPSLDEEAAERKKQEAEWRVRFANARERVSTAEANGWYDTVETVFVNGIPVQQRVRKFQETEELRQARQALADLEEEFRRTGLPPG
jgi:hypothetical protein